MVRNGRAQQADPLRMLQGVLDTLEQLLDRSVARRAEDVPRDAEAAAASAPARALDQRHVGELGVLGQHSRVRFGGSDVVHPLALNGAESRRTRRYVDSGDGRELVEQVLTGPV